MISATRKTAEIRTQTHKSLVGHVGARPLPPSCVTPRVAKIATPTEGNPQKPSLATGRKRKISNTDGYKAPWNIRHKVAHASEFNGSGHWLLQIVHVYQLIFATYERHARRTSRTNISRTTKLRSIPSSLPCANIHITPRTSTVKHRLDASVGEHLTKALCVQKRRIILVVPHGRPILTKWM